MIKIKKICFIFCLLFVLFCSFKVSPKSNAMIITDNTSELCVSYWSPYSANYRFDEYAVAIPNDSLLPGNLNSVNGEIYFYDSSFYSEGGSENFETEYSGTIDGNGYVNSVYWQTKSNEPGTNGVVTVQDSSFINTTVFDALDSLGGDLRQTLLFGTHSYDRDFLISSINNNVKLYELSSPFVNDLYTVNYQIWISLADNSFEYEKNGHTWVGSAYHTEIFEGSTLINFGDTVYADFTFYNLSNDIKEFILNSSTDVGFKTILVGGTISIDYEFWDSIIVNNFDFKQRILAHRYSDYQGNTDYGGGMVPQPYFDDYNYHLPGGLPNSGSGGNCEDNSNFIPDLSNSLLKGLSNFLTFEISPGFSLYHILLLVVAIPLLILILKLFLGG